MKFLALLSAPVFLAVAATPACAPQAKPCPCHAQAAKGPANQPEKNVDAAPSAPLAAKSDLAVGGGNGRLPAAPSAGCGKTNPTSGEATLQIDERVAHYIVSLPKGYDAKTPLPLVFTFHGRNRTDKDCKETDCRGVQDELGDDAVLVYMKSPAGPGWEKEDELSHSVAFFDEVLKLAKESYCVDEHRVFAAGTSSGANFTNILACRYGSALRGVVPVAGRMLETTDCKGPVPALLIHGVDDDKITLPQGIEAREQYRVWNGCAEQSVPGVPELHERVVKARESHECAEYQDCKAGLPVVWCEHSEGGYDGSTHGWPNFGGHEIARFIERF